MEPKRKRMKISHSQEDFFERLSDDFIIERILPYLGTMKTIASLSAVSKRFNRLCLWTPNLDFSVQTTITEEIAAYLDKFFDFHTKKTDLKYDLRSLNLRETGLKNLRTHEKMKSWIRHASSLNLQELFIEMGPRSVLKLPLVLLPWRSLRILSLNQVYMDESAMKFDQWLLHCECLEELYLTDMESSYLEAELRITSSSLRVLSLVTTAILRTFSHIHVAAPELRKLHVVWRPCAFGNYANLRIWTPSLEELSLVKGTMRMDGLLDYSSVQDFQSLQSATIILAEHDRLSVRNLRALLQNISQLQSLQANVHFIRRCRNPPTPFDRLEHLHIFFSVVPNLFPQVFDGKGPAKAVMSFIRKLPLLKTLKFTAYGRIRRRHCKGPYRIQNPSSDRDQQKFLESLECNSSKFGISKLSVCTEANLVADIKLRKGRRGKKLTFHILMHAPKDSEFTISYRPKLDS